ncbi:hypothetical protein ACTFIT_005019 [Dictyostelium discoideum]
MLKNKELSVSFNLRILTSLDDTNYSRRRKPHSGDSVFIKNEGEPLQVNDINSIVLSTLSKSGIDIAKFKSHSTRSAMASLLLSNNIPSTIKESLVKNLGFLNTVVQIS